MSKDARKTGLIGEIAFCLKAEKFGFNVSTPLSDALPYDVLVDNGNQILKVQIKSTSQSFTIDKGKPNYNLFKFFVARSAGKKSYVKNEVDFFALYLIPYNIFFIVPFKEVKTKSVRVYLNNKKHKMHQFRENWLLLK